MAISISPVPPILQKKQLGAGGRIEFVTGLLVAMSALAIVLVPLWVWILDRVFARHAELYPLAVAKVMLTRSSSRSPSACSSAASCRRRSAHRGR